MKRLLLFISVASIFSVSKLSAQSDGSPYRHNYIIMPGNPAPVNNSGNGGQTPNSSGFSGTGANINVVYHRINWTIDPNSATKTISGTVVTYFKTTQANVSSLSFDLNKASFNNGSLVITYHGSACTKSFPASGLVNIVNITLPSTIVATNTLDSISIAYSGIPPGVSGAAEGYQAGGSGIDKYVMTLSESYEDRDWWPCKADMQDKIDSMDINVTVPWVTASADTFWVATNGKLIDSTITASNRTFKFQTRYATPSYLVAVSVAKFTRYYRVVNIGGTNVQVAYYLLRNTASQPTITAAMDKINLVLSAFSTKFGDYPFKLEKHGFYGGLLGAGGMEHQTFSAIANGSLSDLKTLTHELMHQWFGDNVTFATWNDLWLAEGFARYSEALAGELVPSLGINAYTTRSGFRSAALALNTASTWIPNSSMSNSDLIWNSNYGSTVYERGCMVVSMLRALSGDTKFFQAVTNYQTNMAGRSATTDSLKNYFNAVLGIDISNFFTDYVGGSGSAATATGGVGNPIINVNWNSPATNKLVLQVGSQTRTAGTNVTYFRGPVVVHVTNAATGWTKDTTIVFFDWGGGNLSFAGNGVSAPIGGNLLSYNLSFTPTNVFYDDSARTMSTGSVSKLSTLALNYSNIKAYEKPGIGIQVEWAVQNDMPIIKYEVEKSADGISFNLAGTVTATGTNGNGAAYSWLDVNLLAGNNFYRIKGIATTGEISYSRIVNVKTGILDAHISIYPNPVVNKQINVQFMGADKGLYQIRILNNTGQQVFKHDVLHTGGSATEAMGIGNVSAGQYFIEIIHPDHTKTTRPITVSN